FTREFKYTTLAQALLQGIPNAVGQLQNIIPGSISLNWFPAIDSNGSWFEYTRSTFGGDTTIDKYYAQEIVAGMTLPLTLTCTPPMSGFLLTGTMTPAPSVSTVADVVDAIAAGIQSMIIALCGATTTRTAMFSVVATGKTIPWYAATLVWAKSGIAYGGLLVGGLDQSQRPGSVL